MEAYCVKCKTQREIQLPKAVFNKNGAPAVSGTCPVCSSLMYRMGRIEEHDQLVPPEKVKSPGINRSGKLVIVESPAKARTVSRFLGKEFDVRASVGHVRDLLRSQLSVDVDNDFQPKYRVPNEKRPIVRELKNLSARAGEVFLATDPDREGEAIAWHLMESAEIDPDISRRVVFHEITQPAILEAFNNTREVNMDLVDAQQARRILDRLVGYNLSPLLWRKIRGRLSAGRVQSVALRLVVDREREIGSFVPVEYWSIEAEFQPEGISDTYIAKLVRIDEEEISFENEGSVKPVLEDMETASYQISAIKSGTRKRTPAPPFITSTLQQEASRRLGMQTRRVMAIAQQLYEGIDIGHEEMVGLITYMRTDSTNISDLAKEEARQFIQKRYGEQFLPGSPREYKTNVRGAQEAHEAIRPTSINRQPQMMKEYLNRDQYRLYKLIWQRFVASQMASTVYDTLLVEVEGVTKPHKYLLRASGSKIRFQGYLIVYDEIKDEDVNEKDDVGVRIPDGIIEGQKQFLRRLIPEQHFTQPPPRYTEASLVKALEEFGIGRPSTYAPILATLQQRGYVTRNGKSLYPTETGFIVTDLLIENFPEILDVCFTADLEEKLDMIASGELPWVKVVQDFYIPFKESIDLADKKLPKVNSEPEKIGRDCPKCGNELVIRWGRFGKFISCGNFPVCRFTEPWLEKTGVKCPLDGGDVVERKTRRGRIFYGCSNYPECEFTSWKKPIETPCPACGGLLVFSGNHTVECTRCGEKFSLDMISEVKVEPEGA